MNTDHTTVCCCSSDLRIESNEEGSFLTINGNPLFGSSGRLLVHRSRPLFDHMVHELAVHRTMTVKDERLAEPRFVGSYLMLEIMTDFIKCGTDDLTNHFAAILLNDGVLHPVVGPEALEQHGCWQPLQTWLGDDLSTLRADALEKSRVAWNLNLSATLPTDTTDVDSQRRLGIAYELGNGVEQNYETAGEWYRRAADQGDSESQWRIGDLYYFGRGVRKSKRTAKQWYKCSAMQGNDEAAWHLGYAYENDPENHHLERAACWYRVSADNGNPEGQTRLGFLYESGRGVRQDLDEAKRWYGLATKYDDRALKECSTRSRKVIVRLRASYLSLSPEQRTAVMVLSANHRSVLLPMALVLGLCTQDEYVEGVMAAGGILECFPDARPARSAGARQEIQQQAQAAMEFVRVAAVG